MSDIFLPQTAHTPEVVLNPLNGLLIMKGESYPENVLSFYAPILERLREALDQGNLKAFRVEMHITYYNSASAKAFFRIFQLLNKAAEEHLAVRLLWHFHEEDDMARELGENIREDFPSLDIEEVIVDAA